MTTFNMILYIAEMAQEMTNATYCGYSVLELSGRVAITFAIMIPVYTVIIKKLKEELEG